jgi:hypothetical protein
VWLTPTRAARGGLLARTLNGRKRLCAADRDGGVAHGALGEVFLPLGIAFAGDPLLLPSANHMIAPGSDVVR